ncbi:ABC transporter ATP-binding protein [Helicobacter monodelphidis]|uniref:ABC transporter ATP-binding protein n=1 Tax=Helicobacter sp. 15-1451 TaxID=2004995 RepID=UPI000DCD446D|nr:ABC transporter ATP-binding protein [Helicobacter sp. 15-1451]RAX58618.1 ABC transporter ATP-binding protein [Helicobacter sp. 15-1451]
MLLEAKGLEHTFDYPLFHSVNLQGKAGESISIVGLSGSGKSTLLHILSTLLRPQKGSVNLFGQDIYRLKTDDLLAIRRHKVGVVFQSHYLFKGFDAIENLQVAALLTQQEIDKTLLEKFKILHLLNHYAGKLSGGEQQRLSIARVLTKKPQIIFADEPTGNLDQETAFNVMEALFDYIQEQNALLVLVTHDKGLAKCCSHCYELKEQQLILS